VLTKIDLMDPGTDAREVLSGRVISLRRGFVPIVCRSQKDIAEGMPIQAGLTRERAFFERHYAYKGQAGRCGTAYLTRVLSHMLFTAIRTHLPALRSQLSLAAQVCTRVGVQRINTSAGSILPAMSVADTCFRSSHFNAGLRGATSRAG
jgi:hypothetical protein